MAARAQTPSQSAGFTYLGLIILVAIIGLVGAAALKVDSLLRRAEAENELLEVGAAFSDALQSYAAATPKGQSAQPRNLQDLLRDPRFPYVRRHLRKIYVDPVTGKTEWGILYRQDRIGVLAVYSLSNAKPLKIANFNTRFHNFDNKEHISDWKFTASGQGVVELGRARDSFPTARTSQPARENSSYPSVQPTSLGQSDEPLPVVER